MNHNRNDMEPELKGDRLVEAGNWVALVSPSEGLKKTEQGPPSSKLRRDKRPSFFGNECKLAPF